MSYVGSSAAVIPVGFSGVNSQSFNGDGSTVAFTLNRPVSAVNAIEVMVNNVQQSPYDGSYSVSSTTLTFSAAPSSGTANIYVVYRDFPVGSITDTGAVQKTGDTMTGDLIVDTKLGVGKTPSSYLVETFSSTGVNRFESSAATGQAVIHTFTRDGQTAYIGKENSAGNYSFSSGGVSDAFVIAHYNSTAPIQIGHNTPQVTIDSAGRVTMPYQPAFSYVGTSYSQSTGTWSIVIPATTVLNRGGHYNGSTGVFTAPVDGYYVFGFWGLSYPHYNGETNSLQYWKNGGSGSNNIQFNGASSAHALASGGWGVYLYANDTVDLRYYRGSGSAYAYPSQWNMWGYLAN